MRPEILFPLFRPVTALNGVGPKAAANLERLAVRRVVDLYWHLPVGLIDRRYAPRLADARPGVIATLTLEIGAHQKPHNPRQPYRIHCFDDSGAITLVFFHAHADYLNRVLPEGARRLVSGTIEAYGDSLQMTHPDHIAALENAADIPPVEPVYPLTAGLSLAIMGRAIGQALDEAPALAEWQDAAYLKQNNWPGWSQAIKAVHGPLDQADLEPATPARARLAFDELLANQLALAMVRHHMTRAQGRVIAGDGALRAKVLDALPFSLTGAQKIAVREIVDDMGAGARMLRLLQGDVGSGKTVVALLAMLNAVEAGGQAVLMAPTEILARQHLQTLAPLAATAGLEIAYLSGREKGKARERILASLASGAAHLAVGTHALFQDDVAFDDLCLAVIDEQHRFGVHQRLTLAAKGRVPDVLVMTATPIPRTLMMTAYGDMDVSRLMEKPPGRRPIDTRAFSAGRFGEVVAAVGRAIEAGAQVYWVCPLIEESGTLDLAAAEDRHATLKQRFGARVGLIHGRMKAKDKDASMAAFADGSIDLLVATTVIEVGVDVAAATVMVIEQAERFGLAQLHQLRGRIGRGAKNSYCLLLHSDAMTENARARLRTLCETEDGFRIAEEDLRLRGAGELLGTRQSGLPEFRLAELSVHGGLLAAARDDARLIMQRDPDLAGVRGQALRVLLYLFERDAAIGLLRSG